MNDTIKDAGEHPPLSDAVLSVLNHPDTPDELFSAIKDALLDMSQHVHLDLCSTEILPFALPMILERLEQRKGTSDEQVTFGRFTIILIPS